MSEFNSTHHEENNENSSQINTQGNHNEKEEVSSEPNEKTPEEFIERVLKIACQVDVFKKELKSNHNHLASKILKVLGYRYNSIIANSNFFHYATQTIIVETFNNLIAKIHKNLSFKVVLEFLKNCEIQQDSYLDTLEVLYGSDIYPEERNNALLFLTSIKAAKNQVLENIPEEITQKVFEDCIMTIFREAVRTTISRTEESKDKDSQNNRDLKEAGENFNSTNCSFFELISDLYEFNKYSNSLFYQIKYVFLKNVRSLSELVFNLASITHTNVNDILLKLNLKKVSELYCSGVNFSVQTGKASVKKLQNLKVWIDDTYKTESEKVISSYNEIVKYSSTKYNSLRNWIETSPLKTPLNVPFVFAEYAIGRVNNARAFVHDRIYSPCKGVVVQWTGTVVTILVENTDKFKKNSKSFFSNLEKRLRQLVNDTKEYTYEGKEPLVKVTSDENYFVVSLNRKVSYYPEKVQEFIYHIVERVRKFEISQLRDGAVAVYQNTKTKALDIFAKYKRFLGIKDGEKEKEEDVEEREIILSEKSYQGKQD